MKIRNHSVCEDKLVGTSIHLVHISIFWIGVFVKKTMQANVALKACKHNEPMTRYVALKVLLHYLRLHTVSTAFTTLQCVSNVCVPNSAHRIYAYHTYQPSRAHSDGIFRLHSKFQFEFVMHILNTSS